jgi:uncharacterized protein HemX
MKRVRVAVVFALTLAGTGLGCGPEQKYCFAKHVSCTQAQLDQMAMEEEAAQRERDRLADAGTPSDVGATILDH